jgi:hypothetical protein
MEHHPRFRPAQHTRSVSGPCCAPLRQPRRARASSSSGSSRPACSPLAKVVLDARSCEVRRLPRSGLRLGNLQKSQATVVTEHRSAQVRATVVVTSGRGSRRSARRRVVLR